MKLRSILTLLAVVAALGAGGGCGDDVDCNATCQSIMSCLTEMPGLVRAQFIQESDCLAACGDRSQGFGQTLDSSCPGWDGCAAAELGCAGVARCVDAAQCGR
ncbi:MAG: hypothetical protein KC503_42455 [Myxococcales bacterium]|nr:hypothetical protein [Myxococcales bacterium]